MVRPERRAEPVSYTHLDVYKRQEAWHKIQDVLEERVKAGVEVRVFYDDMGSIGFINTCLLYTSKLVAYEKCFFLDIQNFCDFLQ